MKRPAETREGYTAWHRRQTTTPRRAAVLRGIWQLGITYGRCDADEASIVLRVVPRIVLSLETTEWRTVNHGARGRGLGDLVRFLAGHDLPSVRTDGNLPHQ